MGRQQGNGWEGSRGMDGKTAEAAGGKPPGGVGRMEDTRLGGGEDTIDEEEWKT